MLIPDQVVLQRRTKHCLRSVESQFILKTAKEIKRIEVIWKYKACFWIFKLCITHKPPCLLDKRPHPPAQHTLYLHHPQIDQEESVMQTLPATILEEEQATQSLVKLTQIIVHHHALIHHQHEAQYHHVQITDDKQVY